MKGRDQAFSDAIRAEDEAFLSRPDPNHDVLRQARRALGLDVVAFDYSYDREGRMVLWEANPYALLHYIPGRRAYRSPAVDRTIAAIVHLYYTRAGLPVPGEIERHLGFA